MTEYLKNLSLVSNAKLAQSERYQSGTQRIPVSILSKVNFWLNFFFYLHWKPTLPTLCNYQKTCLNKVYLTKYWLCTWWKLFNFLMITIKIISMVLKSQFPKYLNRVFYNSRPIRWTQQTKNCKKWLSKRKAKHIAELVDTLLRTKSSD